MLSRAVAVACQAARPSLAVARVFRPAQAAPRRCSTASAMVKTVTNAPPVEYSAVLTSIDVSQYETQLAAKVQRLVELFSDLPHPAFDVHRSPPEHYRMR